MQNVDVDLVIVDSLRQDSFLGPRPKVDQAQQFPGDLGGNSRRQFQVERLLHQLPSQRMLWRREQLVHVVFLDNLAFRHHGDAMANLLNNRHLMRYHDNGHSQTAIDASKQVQNGLGRFNVER